MAEEKHPFALAFVALRKLTVPSAQDLEKALKSSFPEKTKIENIEIGKDVVSFKIDGETAMFGFMDRPIPWGDLEGPCATSWLWKDATEQMKSHKAHLIVTLLGDKRTEVERCITLTKILAAATKAFDSVGIYWGPGTVVLSNALLQKEAADAGPDYLPLIVWLEFRVQHNEDKTVNILTTGLSYFDCMDIEVIGSKKPASEIMPMVMSVAAMQLKGDVFKDGDTVGPDEKTKIKTRHAKSFWKERLEKVLKIDM